MAAEANLRTRLRESPGAVRLTTVKFAGQFGDGMFQAALGGAILFSPERATDPLEIAAGFAVLLLPYSLIGPFAGALLDRWDRRSVLVWSFVLRGILIGLAAVQLAIGGGTTPLLATALAAIGVSRFAASGVSASLPRVVRPSWLVPTNSVLVTIGSVITAAGAGASALTIALVGTGDRASAIAAAVSVLGSAVSAVVALGFERRLLGPERGEAASALRDVAAGLLAAVTAVRSSPTVTAAMAGIGAHRIAFGIDTLILVLLLRANTSESVVPAGFAGFGIAVGATAFGMLLAALLTPVVLPRVGRPRTIAAALVVAACVQASLIATLTPDLLVIGAFLLGIAGQTIKLTVDAAMQLDIDDGHRGRVFALQDTVFNVAFVGAIAVAAALVGTSIGHERVLVYVGAAVYLVAALPAVRSIGRTHQ